ncbi:MAG: YbdD/YjiX family protein [Corynebacterium sp.]|nr:YbdD/YjiX family protein [Corynebacterium sp.]
MSSITALTPVNRTGIIASSVFTPLKAVWKYMCNVAGEGDYDLYCDHLRACHPDRPVPTKREYWEARWNAQSSNPEGRCC